MSAPVTHRPPRAPEEKWRGDGAGERYRTERWGASRRARRDPRAVDRLLDAAGVAAGPVLDVACGAGRLRGAIGRGDRRWFGVDASAAMLAASGGSGRVAVALAQALPFPDRTFAAVVANRLLHHVRTERELAAILAELLRVSAGPVVVSFWNARSLPAWRRRLGLGRDEGPSGRIARPAAELERLAAGAGAELVRLHHPLPLLSQQSFAVLRRAAR